MIDGGLRKLFRQHLSKVDWQAIETALTGRGVPDLNGCTDGIEFWIECKQTSAWRVKMRPEQVGWAERRLRAGGRVFVAVRRHTTGTAKKPSCDELWLLTGHAGRPLIDKIGLNGLPNSVMLGQWGGGPARWDWFAVRRALTGANVGSPYLVRSDTLYQS